MISEFFSVFPSIDINDQVYLREIRSEDIKNFYEYITCADVTKFLSDPEIPKSLDEAREELLYWADLFTRRSSVYWAIADKKNDALIGTAGFNSWSKYHRRAEISYDLSSTYWNRGIMTDVVRAITKFAFDHMKVNRIQATVVHYNIGSIKVVEKCHYAQECELVNYGVLHGKSENFFMYAITN